MLLRFGGMPLSMKNYRCGKEVFASDDTRLICGGDLVRIYYREQVEKKRSYVAVGWYCKDCGALYGNEQEEAIALFTKASEKWSLQSERLHYNELA